MLKDQRDPKHPLNVKLETKIYKGLTKIGVVAGLGTAFALGVLTWPIAGIVAASGVGIHAGISAKEKITMMKDKKQKEKKQEIKLASSQEAAYKKEQSNKLLKDEKRLVSVESREDKGNIEEDTEKDTEEFGELEDMNNQIIHEEKELVSQMIDHDSLSPEEKEKKEKEGQRDELEGMSLQQLEERAFLELSGEGDGDIANANAVRETINNAMKGEQPKKELITIILGEPKEYESSDPVLDDGDLGSMFGDDYDDYDDY